MILKAERGTAPAVGNSVAYQNPAGDAGAAEMFAEAWARLTTSPARGRS
jgi:hypothetical protein